MADGQPGAADHPTVAGPVPGDRTPRMDFCAPEQGHLVIFDSTAGKSWEEKIFVREELEGGAPVTVWGM